MNRSFVLFVIAICISVQSRTAAADSPPVAFAAQIKPLLDKYCRECHGPETQEAHLRLDTLATDLSDDRTLATWVRIHDQLATGKMPPPGSERPPPKAIAAGTEWLRQRLHEASLDQQQKQGRVVLRRLNGTEYENTIRDLVGTGVSLKSLLPEDNSAAGFDNVSAVLDVSSTHQLLYQEAAEKAILSAIPVHPPIPFSDQRTGKQMSEKGPNFQQTLTRSCILKGDALIVYSKLPRYGLCCTAHVPFDGRYRVQMSVAAVRGENQPISAAIMTVEQSGREQPVVRDVIEIPAGEPAVIETEIVLKPRQAFVLNLLSEWDIRAFKRPIEEYTGPGLLVEWIKIEGPIDPFPPPSYQKLFGDLPLEARSVAKAKSEGSKPPQIPANRNPLSWPSDPLVPVSADPRVDAERLIRQFLPRAFRRPVSEELQQHFAARVHARLDDKDLFHEAMLYGYKSILSSPHFLLFKEPGSTPLNEQLELASPRLDDFAVANRLAYFLWSTQPDDELMAAAAKGNLTQPQNLRTQVERMLSSPQASRFTENFIGQWLDLRKIDATIPDPQLYSDFDGLLLWSMPRETRLFFDEVLRHDRSLLEFVASDWTILNERLAELYGIAGVSGNAFRKVTLPPGSHRGGVMTQASVLKVTADGTRTSPVLRGKWVLEQILGQHPAPPPADVPAIEPDIRGATTIREQLAKHSNSAACAACHIHIDPPGFALENYDPIGGWRDFYRASTRTKAGIVKLPNNTGRAIFRGPDVEQGGETSEGRTFRDIDEYKQLLLADKDQLARNLTQKLLTYATGADIQFADREVVEQIVATLRTKNYGFRTLVHEVVQSRIFLNK